MIADHLLSLVILIGTYVAALDNGTTGTRCLIFDIAGKEIARDYREWQSFYPSPVAVEQDASAWWEAVRSTIVNAIRLAKIPKEEIVSVAITNQRETIVPVDSTGHPLHNAIVWQDRRTTEECAWIRDTLGPEKIYRTTGLTVDPYFSGSKILWFQRHRPAIYAQAHKFLLVHDFILYKLTGQFYTDFSNASRTMLFDITTQRWSDDLIAGMGLDAAKLPTAVPPGQEIGPIASEDTGFARTTKVIAGAGDQQCAALGVGVVKPGRVKCTTGTGSFMLAYLDKPTFDADRRVLCSCAAVPGTWVQEASIFTTGAALRWFRDNVAVGEQLEALLEKRKGKAVDPYDLMTTQAATSNLGANGLLFIPHMVGAGAPHWNAEARGMLFGLALGHQTADIYRAILEGVAMEIKKNVDVFRALGAPPAELRITGGGSRSALWAQIMADVLGIPCKRGEIEESTAVGAAILAAYGAGIYPDIAKAADEMANITRVWTPDPAKTARYAEYYGIACDIYRALDAAGIYTRLSRVTKHS